jgi:hypothetical protein
MAWGDAFYDKARAKVSDQVGEPVEVIGWASRGGSMNAVVAGTVMRGAMVAMDSPIQTGAMPPRSRMTAPAGDKGSKLPMNFLVALTPTAFRVFKFRKTWTGLRLKKELGALPREGLSLSTTDRGLVRLFVLDGADGSSLTFEMSRVKWTDRFTEQLAGALG